MTIFIKFSNMFCNFSSMKLTTVPCKAQNGNLFSKRRRGILESALNVYK